MTKSEHVERGKVVNQNLPRVDSTDSARPHHRERLFQNLHMSKSSTLYHYRR